MDVKKLLLLGAPILGVVAGWLAVNGGGLEVPAGVCLGIAVWTALWWVTEAVPLPVASLVPLALLPMTGILTSGQVAGAYGHPLVLLLLGGFLLSKAMEKSGAHRRIALKMVNLCGGSGGKTLVLGFMLASAFLSMWISNTATTLMLLPVAIAVMGDAEDQGLRIPLLLGIAYAANVGGIGTPIGTPPNLVFLSAYEEATGIEIGFLGWMKYGVPVAGLMTVAIWFWITRGMKGGSTIRLPERERWTTPEVRTLLVFGVVALLWIFRKEPFGGWSGALGLPGANDASVAFLGVIALFCLPNGEGGKLLDWESAVKVPWGLLLLVSAGVALGAGFAESGLSASLAGLLGGLGNLSPVWIILVIALVVTFLTEMTSNTATTNLLMPILAAAATVNGLDHGLLMIPAAISASCAFMLPVATMPNAVVFATEEIPIRRMVREGMVLNFIGAAVVTSVVYLLV